MPDETATSAADTHDVRRAREILNADGIVSIGRPYADLRDEPRPELARVVKVTCTPALAIGDEGPIPVGFDFTPTDDELVALLSIAGVEDERLSADALALLARIDRTGVGVVPATQEAQDLFDSRCIAGSFMTSPSTGKTTLAIERITPVGYATLRAAKRRTEDTGE